MKINCWEAKRCGREIGGTRAGEMGICPAATDRSALGLNGGMNAGRICWSVAGTLCGGIVQGEQAQKRLTCMTCDFYQTVRAEEEVAGTFQLLRPGQSYCWK